MAYVGFNKLEKKIEKSGKSKESAKKIAASIGMKKYGKKKMEEHAHKGTSMKKEKPKGKK